MTLDISIILAIIFLYFIIILFVGIFSFRYGARSSEDYHMASREFGFLILFFAVFGTNISAVALIGGPGRAYHVGWIGWAHFATAWAWCTPILFYIIGKKAWVIAKIRGFMTVSDVLRYRWNSSTLGYLSSLILLFYTIPYLMVGIMGGGRTFAGLTNGFIPYWLGALIVTVVVCSYVTVGGMRGTGWTNLVQSIVFLLGGIIFFFIISQALGGIQEATQGVAKNYPALMDRSNFPIKTFFSYGIIVTLAVPLFPQVFIRLLTGRRPKELKKVTLIYPLAGLIIWFVVSYIGMWGHLPFPDLQGGKADMILPMLMGKFAPVWMTGILAATIFAALFSSLDAQLLTVGTMVIKDFFLFIKKKGITESKEVRLSRFVVIIFALCAFIVSLLKPMGIITVIEWSFSGYACMIIPLIAALYWKRCTKQAALWSIIVSQFVLLAIPLNILPQEIAFGMLAGIPALALGLITLVFVTYITSPPDKEITESFFKDLNTNI